MWTETATWGELFLQERRHTLATPHLGTHVPAQREPSGLQTDRRLGQTFDPELVVGLRAPAQMFPSVAIRETGGARGEAEAPHAPGQAGRHSPFLRNETLGLMTPGGPPVGMNGNSRRHPCGERSQLCSVRTEHQG